MSRKITKQYNEPDEYIIPWSKIVTVNQYSGTDADGNYFSQQNKTYIDWTQGIAEYEAFGDINDFMEEHELNSEELDSLLEKTLDLYEYAQVISNGIISLQNQGNKKVSLTFVESDPDNKNNFIYKTLKLQNSIIYERKHYLYQIKDNGDWALPVRIIQAPSGKTSEDFFNELKNSKVKIHLFRDVSYNTTLICNHTSEYYFIDKSYKNGVSNILYPTCYSFQYNDNLKAFSDEPVEKNYNCFYENDLRQGDIIDFSIKIPDFSNKKPYLILYKEINLKTSEENIIYPLIVPSNKIYIKNGFFSWSIANFADNLGHELINNAKTGKLCGLKIFNEDNDEDEDDTFIENAIVTYTLLTFDD